MRLTAIAPDSDLEMALEWFYGIDGTQASRGSLARRIRTAQTFFRGQAARMDSPWPDAYQLLLKSDLVASYLAQADAFVRSPESYDLTLAAHIVPFIKHIGAGVVFLQRMPGAVERVRRLLNPKQEHPDGALYELAVAVRYALEGFDVEFVSESTTRSADLRVGPPNETKDLYVECKRLRASSYELREKASVQSLISPLAVLIRQRQLSIVVHVKFTAAIGAVPSGYLVDQVLSAVSSGRKCQNDYPWHDEFAEGIVRAARIDAVRTDTMTTAL